jgi:hypothetical protein
MTQETNAITIEQFQATIKAIVQAQARATKQIGNALLQVLYFANKEGNAGPANELVGALRKSTKQAGIMALLEAEGNLAWTKVGKKPGFVEFDAKKEWTPETVERLRDVCSRWEEYKPATKQEPIDVLKMLEAIVKKATASKENHKEVTHFELVEGINKLLAKAAAVTIDSQIKA